MRRSALLLLGLIGCDTPTVGVVENHFSDDTAVYRVWWETTIFLDPLAPGEASDLERIVPASDRLYAILAPGWDITSSTPPPKLLPVRSAEALTAIRGTTLHLVLDANAVVGDCAAGKPLTEDEAELITQRIFPGSFLGGSYDAKTCTFAAFPLDGGP